LSEISKAFIVREAYLCMSRDFDRKNVKKGKSKWPGKKFT